MKILIIGAAGMIGRKLAERLASSGELDGKPIASLTLHDVVPAGQPAGAKMPVRIVVSDLPAPAEAEKLLAERPHISFHLAPIGSGAAEPDFDKGYRRNLR